MNFLPNLLIALIFFSSPLFALEPLNVGVESFDPPFVIQQGSNAVFGFDIDMMNSLCKKIDRTCRFKIMKFDDLIPAVANKTVDVAVSSITITSDRSKLVNFSAPYLLSYSRFLSKKLTNKTSFGLNLLNGKRIGIVTGTIFVQQLQDMGVKDPVIVYFDRVQESLEALSSDDVDFLLVDNPTALYWETNSSGAFAAVGPPYMYGYGLGIAVNNTDAGLLKSINQALIQYQASTDYKNNFETYLQQF